MDILSNRLTQTIEDNSVYFHGGYGYIPNSSRALQILPLSISFTYDVDEWSTSDNQNTVYFVNANAYYSKETDASTTVIDSAKCGLSVNYNKSNKTLYVLYGNKDNTENAMTVYYYIGTEYGRVYYTDLMPDINGLPLGKHTITVVFTKDIYNTANGYATTVIPVSDTTTAGILATKVYIDGYLLHRANGDYIGRPHTQSITNPADSYINPWGLFGVAARNYGGGQGWGNIALDHFSIVKLSRVKVFNFDMSSDDAAYTVQDYADDKDTPEHLDGKDFKLTDSEKNISGDITTTLNITNTDGVFTFNYPPVATGYRTYTIQLPTDGTTLTNVSATTIVGEQAVTMTGDIDNATTPTTFSFKGFQILCSNESWQRYSVGKWGGIWRGLCMCKTVTDDLPDNIDYGILIGGTHALFSAGVSSPYFLGYTPETTNIKWGKTKVSFWIKRVTDKTYFGFSIGLKATTYVTISLADLPLNEWVKKEYILNINDTNNAPFAFAANSLVYSYSGVGSVINEWSVCIADVNIEPLRDIIDLDNDFENNNTWLDKSSNTNNLTLTGDYDITDI